MSVTETKAEERSEEEAPEEQEARAVVLHLRTLTDEHSYVQFGSEKEAEAFANEIRANSPGRYEAETFPVSEAQEILDANPPPDEPDEVTPLSSGQAEAQHRQVSGIPDRNTLNNMSRADLDVIAADNGLDPEEYRNKDEIVDALDKARS